MQCLKWEQAKHETPLVGPPSLLSYSYLLIFLSHTHATHTNLTSLSHTHTQTTSLALSLSLSRTHTYIHARTYTHNQFGSLALSLSLSLTHTHSSHTLPKYHCSLIITHCPPPPRLTQTQFGPLSHSSLLITYLCFVLFCLQFKPVDIIVGSEVIYSVGHGGLLLDVLDAYLVPGGTFYQVCATDRVVLTSHLLSALSLSLSLCVCVWLTCHVRKL